MTKINAFCITFYAESDFDGPRGQKMPKRVFFNFFDFFWVMSFFVNY